MKQEVSIQALIDKIKVEGIEKARAEADEMMKDAKVRAASIIQEAEARAQKITAESEASTRKTQRAFESSMQRAARHLVQAVRVEIVHLCEKIMEREVASSLTPEIMKEMLVHLIKGWQKQEQAVDVEILLSAKDRQALEELLYRSLQDDLKKGVTIKPIERIQAGFRIGEKDGAMHYDFSHQGIAEILSEYLNPRISRFLKDIPQEKD